MLLDNPHITCGVLRMVALGGSGCDGFLGVPQVKEQASSGSENAASGGEGRDDDDPGASSANGSSEEFDRAACGLPAARVRMLTNEQYDNTVRDLLGISSSLGSSFPGEQVVGGFSNNAKAALASFQLVNDYAAAADELSARAVTDLAQLMPCDAEGPQCVKRFIREFGRRAYRRPLTSDEVDHLYGVFETGSEYGFSDGIEFVINSVLQSPSFLYSEEGLGEDGRIEPFSLASKMSYFLWNTMPDDELLAAAESGDLNDPEELVRQAERMIDDPRSRDTVRSFLHQWLELDDLEFLSFSREKFPEYFPELSGLWQEQLLLFAEDAIFSGNGFEDLLSGQYTFVNDDMAGVYGLDLPGSEELTRVELPAERPGGLLGQPGLMAAHSKAHPGIYRGQFVLSRFLCGGLPPPPDMLTTPEVDLEGLTLREYTDALTTSEASCATCHSVMNPIGHAFGEFDNLGRYSLIDRYGYDVDASVELSLDGSTVNVNGAAELSRVMSESVDVRECFVRNFYRYAARRVETDADRCALQDLATSFDDAGDVRSLLLSIVTDDSFTHGVSL